jgi:ribosomal protein S18 acetylase RimI-like enzyme
MRDRLLDFELAISERASEEVVEFEWGRVFLSPSLPLAWDASWALVERAGMTAAEVVAAADESLAGFAHRAIAIRDEAEGARLAGEIGGIPGWETEANLYMAWRETVISPGDGVRECGLDDCEGLRRELIRGEFPPEMADLDETADQLLEMNRRADAAAGDRWFVAPAPQPAAACCLLSGAGIGQVENVGTLAPARGNGYAKAVVSAALAASREAGHEITLIVADADDWPRLMYEKLGFETRGLLHVFRRPPTAGTSA